MVLWILTFLAALLGLASLFSGLEISKFFNSKTKKEKESARKCVFLLHEYQETLEAGLVPRKEQWDALAEIGAPWGDLAHESISKLRAQGGAILPTLRRIRALAENHLTRIQESKAKASQAFAQALICAALAPLFGIFLYGLVPGIAERSLIWFLVCSLATLWTLIGTLWLISISEDARWGGLSGDQRNWILGAQCAGERFLAVVRAGTPPDLAWVQAGEFLRSHCPDLLEQWGSSIWKSEEGQPVQKNALAQVIAETGTHLRRCIQSSVMDGKPCTERVENALQALRSEVRTRIDQELSMLATRALKPLFLCVAPPILGLLASGLFLGAADAFRL